MPTEKPKEFKTAWKRLLRYMRPYWPMLILSIVFSVAGTILTVIGPDKLKEMTDLISASLPSMLNPMGADMDIAKIATIGVTLAAIYGASALLQLFQGLLMATATQRTAANLRRDISRKINKVPLRFFDKSSTGDVMSRVTNDADTMGQAMNASIGTLIGAITLFFGSLTMMAVTNLTMMAVAVLSSFAGFILMIVIMSRSQKYFNMQQDNLGLMNGHVAEVFGAHAIVRTYNGEKDAIAKFDAINADLEKSAFRSQFMSGLMMPLMTFIGNFGYVMVCVVGAAMVMDGSIGIGTIVAFMLYVRLFTQPLSQMSQAFASMQSVAAAAERVFEFLDEEELPDESAKTEVLERAKGRIEFRDVHFGYTPGKEVIRGFSAVAEPGQKIAIVGPTGAGKTTMVNLLMRFYDVGSGEILIDGIPVRNLTRENVHDQFCMVLQDTWLFEGTIRENVAYCRKGVTDEMVESACKAVGIHHFIENLPDGYDTRLSDATSLSAGQRQQLTIARAMIDDSPILILDEATSSVDTRTERIIQEAMDSLAENRTSFVIAHRLSTIKNSDLILVMRDGSIVEHGTHDELLAKGGFYEELYDSQFEDVEME